MSSIGPRAQDDLSVFRYNCCVLQEVPNTGFCLDCGYPLFGLREPVCPECGRRFNPADSTTYRSAGAEECSRLTPLHTGCIGLAAYIGCLVVLECLHPGTVKGTVSMSIQPILMITGTILAIFTICWAWRNRRQRAQTILIAVVLLLVILAIHLPSYLAVLDEIAAVRAAFGRPSGA